MPTKRPKISIREPKQRYGTPDRHVPEVGMPHERWQQPHHSVEGLGEPSSTAGPEHTLTRADDITSKLTTSSLSSYAAQTTRATLASKGSSGGNGSVGLADDPEADRARATATRGRATERRPLLHGRTRDVWQFIVKSARNANGGSGGGRVKLSRREIKEGTGIGSYNTIDQAIIDLQSYGLLAVYPLFGSNKGYEYELLRTDEDPESEEQAPQAIAEALRETAQAIERSGVAHLSGDQLKELTRLALSARRLTSEIARRQA